MPVLAVAVAAGAVYGALMLAELGPFSPSVSVPPVRFEPEVYRGEPEMIVLSDVAALTTAPSTGDTTFVAVNLVDDDPSTTWRSDSAALPEELNETIELVPEQPIWLDRLYIRNGDHRTPAAYEQTSRIRQALLTVDGGVVVLLDLLDVGTSPQMVVLDEPVLTTTVRLEVLSRFEGDVDDITVSDLDLLGFPADEHDAALAAQRAAVLPASSANGALPAQPS